MNTHNIHSATPGDEFPSVKQISAAAHQLRMASWTAEGIEFSAGYIPEHIAVIHRRLCLDYLKQAVAALGYELVERQPLRIAVSNDEADHVTGISR